jgi:hydrogenase-4 component F
MIPLLVLFPFAAAAVAVLARRPAAARAVTVAAAAVQLALTAAAWALRPGPAWNGWIAADDTALPILTVTVLLVLAAAIRIAGSPRRESTDGRDMPDPVVAGCLLALLGTMSLAAVSRHLGLLWVAVEGTTLASAPLIYLRRSPRALEATWKYLLICSVGIALALLGTFLLAASADPTGTRAVSLSLDDLVRDAASLQAPWLKASFIFFLVGYGTKMGLAPMHTWLPDAHSEAPSAVSALLSGAVLNAAFLALLRVHQVCAAAGLGEFSGGLLSGLGLLSVGVAAFFLLGQPDYKRMLAYSSVEHMGLLALGAGAGAAGIFGALLHAVNHSLVKGALFLTAGRILDASGTKKAAEVRGLRVAMPATAALWVAGLFAIAGAPPFGTFLSEVSLFKALFDAGRWKTGLAALLLLAVAFAGMSRTMLGMLGGKRAPGDAPLRMPASRRADAATWLPAAALLALAVVLGLYVPGFLRTTLQSAAAAAGGAP